MPYTILDAWNISVYKTDKNNFCRAYILVEEINNKKIKIILNVINILRSMEKG